MPLYDQSTNLAAQGKFAPGVNYRADIRKPAQPMPSFPKGQYQFNVNLDSIGRALAQMSRDQAETEQTKFKLEYAQKEKAEAAAEKQLKIDMSNQYAQDIADITALVDQKGLSPLEAARRMREVDDKYRQYGVLNASEMASIKGSWDGGIASYQENTREQLRKSEIAFDEERRQELIKEVPSVAGLSRDEQLLLWYNLNNADMQLGDAVKLHNANPSQENTSLLQDKADLLADYQTQTVMMNALNNDKRYSTAEMFDMTVVNVENALSQRGVTNPQMRAYAAKKAYNRYAALAEAKSKYTDETLKYLKNQNGIIDEATMYAMRTNDPLAWTAVLAEKNGLDLGLPSDRYTDDVSGKRRIKYGDYTINIPYYESDGKGNIFDKVKENVPVDYRNYLLGTQDIPTETKSLIFGRGAVPAGQVGEIGSIGTVAGAYDSNVTPPGSVIYNSSTTPAQISNAYNNNSKYMNNTKNNPVTIDNMKRQDAYAGTNRVKELQNLDFSKAYNILNSSRDIKQEADSIHTKNVLPFSTSGQYAALYSSIVLDENTGDLSLLNNYKTSGELEDAAALFTAYNAKNALEEINKFTLKVFPNDIEGRKQLARSMFHGMYPSQLPSYESGMGGATLKPTISEKIAYGALEIGDYAADKFSKYILPSLKKAYEETSKKIEEKYNTKKEELVKLYEEKKKVNPNLTPQQFVKDLSIEAIQDATNTIVNKIEYANDLYNIEQIGESGGLAGIIGSEEPKKEQSLSEKLLDKSIKGLEKVSQYIAEKMGVKTDESSVEKPEIANTWDIQLGNLNYKDPLGLPIRFNEDGTWSNMLYETVTSDGRTYVVPGLDDRGELSTGKDELAKGRYFFSLKGADKESIQRAEELAERLRQYVIDINKPYVDVLSKDLGGGLSGEIENISDPKKKSVIKKIIEVNDAFGEGAFEGSKEFIEGWGKEIEDNILPIGKMIAYNAIAEKYGYIDAQQMLEDTDTGLRGQIMIPATMIPARTAYKVIDWIANEAPDIKPITWLKKLFKNDEAKILDAAAAVFVGGDASKREKEKFIKSYKTWKEQNLEADTAYYQNFSGIN